MSISELSRPPKVEGSTRTAVARAPRRPAVRSASGQPGSTEGVIATSAALRSGRIAGDVVAHRRGLGGALDPGHRCAVASGQVTAGQAEVDQPVGRRQNQDAARGREASPDHEAAEWVAAAQLDRSKLELAAPSA